MVPWELWRGIINVFIFWEAPFWTCVSLAVLQFYFSVKCFQSDSLLGWAEKRFLRCTVKQALCVKQIPHTHRRLMHISPPPRPPLPPPRPHCLNYKISVILDCLRMDWPDKGKRRWSNPIRFRISHLLGVWQSCENCLCQALCLWTIYPTSSRLAHFWDCGILSITGCWKELDLEWEAHFYPLFNFSLELGLSYCFSIFVTSKKEREILETFSWQVEVVLKQV